MAAGRWTVLHAQNIASATFGGSFTNRGVLQELTYASNIQFNHDLTEGATLSFSMPGNLLQSARIEVRNHDIVLVRDDVVMQRFKVWGRQMVESNGIWIANYTCISYKQFFAKQLTQYLHDPRSYTGLDTTEIAWLVAKSVNDKPGGFMRLKRGTALTSIGGGGTGPFFTYPDSASGVIPIGKSKLEIINEVAGLGTTFDWDIQPGNGIYDIFAGIGTPPSEQDKFGTLVFSAWVGGRSRYGTGNAPLALDFGGSFINISHTTTSDTYTNVLFYGGNVVTGGDGSGGVYRPSGFNPDPFHTAQGRFETAIMNPEITDYAVLSSAATAKLAELQNQPAQIQGTIARGKWDGPASLYIGDFCKTTISVPAVQVIDGSPVPVPGEYALDVSDVSRVISIAVSIDTDGVEDVTVTLDRSLAQLATMNQVRAVQDRVTRLERR